MISLNTNKLKTHLIFSLSFALITYCYYVRLPLSLTKANLDFDEYFDTTAEGLGILDFFMFFSALLGRIFFVKFFRVVLPKLKFKYRVLLFAVLMFFSTQNLMLYFEEIPKIALFFGFFFQEAAFAYLPSVMMRQLPPGHSRDLLDNSFAAAAFLGTMAPYIAQPYIEDTIHYKAAYYIPCFAKNMIFVLLCLLIWRQGPDESESIEKVRVTADVSEIFKISKNLKLTLVSMSIVIVRFTRYVIIMWLPYFLIENEFLINWVVPKIFLPFVITSFVGYRFGKQLYDRSSGRHVVKYVIVCNVISTYTVWTLISWPWITMPLSVVAGLAIVGFSSGCSDSLLSGSLLSDSDVGEQTNVLKSLHFVDFFLDILAGMAQGPIFGRNLLYQDWNEAFLSSAYVSVLSIILPLLLLLLRA